MIINCNQLEFFVIFFYCSSHEIACFVVSDYDLIIRRLQDPLQIVFAYPRRSYWKFLCSSEFSLPGQKIVIISFGRASVD